MGNTSSSHSDSLPWPTVKESYIGKAEAEPEEIETEDEIEWFVLNIHHRTFWSKLRALKEDYGQYSKYEQVKKRITKQYETKTTLSGGVSQEKTLKENKTRIAKLLKKNCHGQTQLTKIVSESALITQCNIPQEIVAVMVLYVGNGLIPICYTVPAILFKHFVADSKEHQEALGRWWEEIRLSPGHRGVFWPQDMQRAAEEFDEFIIEKLAEDGDSLKYQHSMIPHMLVNKVYNVWDRNKDVLVRLPTKYSKCVGGIELFQRLYLEACFDAKQQFEGFNVELKNIQETHGDNWCFDGSAVVLMASGEYRRVDELRVGDQVVSFPNVASRVKCTITSNVNADIEMVRLPNNCWITFEHPVLLTADCTMQFEYDDIVSLNSAEIEKYGLKWALPKDVYPVEMRYQDRIYNFVLDSHHTINVNGNWCCTLGHDYKGTVIEHEFWGNSKRIDHFLRTQSATYPDVVFH